MAVEPEKSAKGRARVARPRYPLSRRAALWAVLIAVIPAMLGALWSTRVANQALTEHHARNVAMLGQTLAVSLAHEWGSEAWSGQAQAILDSMRHDSRLCFVIVTDSHGNPLLRRTADPQAWAAYVNWSRSAQAPGAGSVDLERPIVLGDRGELVVRKVAVWDPPMVDAVSRQSPSFGAVRPGLRGFIIIGLRDPGMPMTLARIRALQMPGAVALCVVSAPLVWWLLRRWSRPLHTLSGAANRLGQGHDPQPVPVPSDPDLGALAEAFNRMAENLAGARRQLVGANEQLEANVHARTAELEQLNQRLASELRDKDQFMRALSHDLGAPLRNITGMASLLLLKYREQLADDALAKLERISANARLQSEMIAELTELTLIRTRPGKREALDLHALVNQVLGSLAYDLERTGVAVEIKGPLPTIHADRHRLYQLLQNLLENAVKFTEQAPRKLVTIACHPEDHELHFTITDTGAGIAPEDLAQVFQVFRRGRQTTAAPVPGRGVGLATAKSIVECHAGRIWIESALGVGTTVHFTLDRRLVEPPAQPAAAVEPA